MEFSSFITNYDTTVTLNYNVKVLKEHIAPDEVDLYNKKVSQILPQLGFILTKNKDFAFESPSTEKNWLLIILACIALCACLYLAYKVYFNYDPYSPNKKIAYDHIGGWLVVFAFAITVNPFIRFINFFSYGYFNQDTWISITGSSSYFFNSVISLLLIVELLVAVGFFVFSILLVILFYKRRSSFPILVIGFFVSNFGFILFEILFIFALGVQNELEMKDHYITLIQSLVPVIVWVPYFLKSTRVKETFVLTIKENSDIPKEDKPKDVMKSNSDTLEDPVVSV